MSTIRTFARSHPLLVTAVGLAIGLAVIWFVPSDGSLANMMFIRLGLTIVMFAIMAVAAGCNIIVPNAKSIGLSFKKSIYPLVVALVMGVFVLLGTAMKNEGMVSDWPLQLALVIMLCLLVGTFEEGLFRGVVFSGLLARFGETRRGLIGAVIVSSLIFGFVHVTPSIMNGQVVTGLDMAQAALKTLQAGILGAFLAALFLKTQHLGHRAGSWPQRPFRDAGRRAFFRHHVHHVRQQRRDDGQRISRHVRGVLPAVHPHHRLDGAHAQASRNPLQRPLCR